MLSAPFSPPKKGILLPLFSNLGVYDILGDKNSFSLLVPTLAKENISSSEWDLISDATLDYELML